VTVAHPRKPCSSQEDDGDDDDNDDDEGRVSWKKNG